MKHAPDTSSRSAVTESITFVPPRSTTKSAALRPAICTSVCISVQVRTACPLTAVTRSPGNIPAFAAGPFGTTLPISAGISPKRAPGTAANTNARMTARTMLPNGPANATAMRTSGVASLICDAPFALPPSRAFVPSGSSCGKDTYPPNGIAEMRYSTSPIVFFQSAGPKPIENLSTRRPSHFATIKWPNSWIKIANEKSKTHATIAPTVSRISMAKNYSINRPEPCMTSEQTERNALDNDDRENFLVEARVHRKDHHLAGLLRRQRAVRRNLR